MSTESHSTIGLNHIAVEKRSVEATINIKVAERKWIQFTKLADLHVLQRFYRYISKKQIM